MRQFPKNLPDTDNKKIMKRFQCNDKRIMKILSSSRKMGVTEMKHAKNAERNLGMRSFNRGRLKRARSAQARVCM